MALGLDDVMKHHAPLRPHRLSRGPEAVRRVKQCAVWRAGLRQPQHDVESADPNPNWASFQFTIPQPRFVQCPGHHPHAGTHQLSSVSPWQHTCGLNIKLLLYRHVFVAVYCMHILCSSLWHPISCAPSRVYVLHACSLMGGVHPHVCVIHASLRLCAHYIRAQC